MSESVHSPREAMRVETEQQRMAFLGQVGRALLSSLDYRVTLQRLSDLAVPALGDWCVVDMVREDGSYARLAVTHPDPKKVQVAHELWNRYPPKPTDLVGLPNVIRTGKPELYPHIPDELLEQVSHGPEHLALIRSLGLRSYLMVPLTAKGRVLGTLTLVQAESDHHYDEQDLAFAEEFARLAAIAVDNARLFESETAARAKAESSERSFRTFIDNLPELAWTALPDGHIDFYNRRWYEYTGTTFEEMQGWGWEKVHAPKLLPLVVDHWKHSLATGEPFEMEFTLRSADGTPRWFLTRVSPQRDEQGKIIRWFGTNTDIHDIRAAKALAEEMALQSRDTQALLLDLRRQKELAERRAADLEAELARIRRE